MKNLKKFEELRDHADIIDNDEYSLQRDNKISEVFERIMLPAMKQTFNELTSDGIFDEDEFDYTIKYLIDEAIAQRKYK